MLYAYNSYKTGFIIFLCYRLFINMNICFDISGLPLLTLDMMMQFYFMTLYYVKRDTLANVDPFPFRKVTFFFIAVDVLSSIFAIGGFGTAITPALYHITDLILLLIIWDVLDCTAMQKLIRCLLFVAFIAGVYGIYEKIIGYNPLALYEIQLGAARAVDWTYLDDARGYRVQSIFIHPIGAGINFAYLSLLFWIYMKYTNISHIERYIITAILILMLLCCLFANSRGPIIYLICASLVFINVKRKSTIIIVLLLAVLTILNTSLIVEYKDMLTSIFDVQNKNEYVGSDYNMRLRQFEAALKIFSEYPLLGLGTRGNEYYYDKTVASALLGLESIWIVLMVQKGIMGIAAFVSYVYDIMKTKLPLYAHRDVCILMIAYIAVNSVTTLPGSYMFLHFLAIWYIIKKNIYDCEELCGKR